MNTPHEPAPCEPPPTGHQERIFRQSVTGVVWSFVERAGAAVISVGVHVVLARLLAPEHFGLVAMAGVVIGFVGLIKDTGFDDAIVQRRELDPLHLDTAFWATTGLSLFLAFAGVVAAPGVAWLFNEPQLTGVFQVLVLGIPLMSTSALPTAILRRRMDFKPLSLRSLLSATAGGAIAVGMALQGFGVWSLVAQNFAQRAVDALVLWRACGWVPRLRFSAPHFRELFSFGGMITLDRVLNFFNRQYDDLIVGALLGPSALGYYTVAYEILKGMTDIVIRTVSSVAMPMFSRLQGQMDELRAAYLGAVQFGSLLGFPLFAMFAVLASDLFALVYGPQWAPAVAPAQVLALVGVIHAVSLVNGALLQGLGKLRWSLGLTAANGVLNVIGFSFAAWYFGTTTAVASSYAVVCYIMVPITVAIVGGLLGFRARDYLRQLAFPTAASAITAGVLLALQAAWHDATPPFVRVPVAIVVGAALYLALAWRLLPASTRGSIGRVWAVLRRPSKT